GGEVDLLDSQNVTSQLLVMIGYSVVVAGDAPPFIPRLPTMETLPQVAKWDPLTCPCPYRAASALDLWTSAAVHPRPLAEPHCRRWGVEPHNPDVQGVHPAMRRPAEFAPGPNPRDSLPAQC